MVIVFHGDRYTDTTRIRLFQRRFLSFWKNIDHSGPASKRAERGCPAINDCPVKALTGQMSTHSRHSPQRVSIGCRSVSRGASVSTVAHRTRGPMSGVIKRQFFPIQPSPGQMRAQFVRKAGPDPIIIHPFGCRNRKRVVSLALQYTGQTGCNPVKAGIDDIIPMGTIADGCGTSGAWGQLVDDGMKQGDANGDASGIFCHLHPSLFENRATGQGTDRRCRNNPLPSSWPHQEAVSQGSSVLRNRRNITKKLIPCDAACKFLRRHQN